MQHPDFNDATLAEAASTFAALGSEQRLMVLRILVRAGPTGLSIGELGERSGITGATLTHHMKTLAATRLVEQERRGRSVICIAANFGELERLTQSFLQECCADCSSQSDAQSTAHHHTPHTPAPHKDDSDV